MCAQSLSSIQLFVSPRTVAHQAPLSMGFSRQEFWSGLPFPTPGIEPAFPASGRFFTTVPPSQGHQRAADRGQLFVAAGEPAL